MITVEGKLSGRYQISKGKIGSDIPTHVYPEFPNEITDIGLEAFANSSTNCFAYCYVATSSTPPTTSDTNMAGFVGATNQVLSAPLNRTVSAPYWVERSIVYRFNPPTAAGNLASVGVGWTADSTNGTFSRALIVDGGGSPITITILSDEWLDVTYTIRYYPPLDTVNYTINLSGVDYNCSTRISNVTSASISPGNSWYAAYLGDFLGGPCALGPVTGTITGATSAVSLFGISGAGAAYVPGSHTLKVAYSLGLDQGNVTGGVTGITHVIGVTGLGDAVGRIYSTFQTTVSPAIPKTASKIMSISLSWSWARYTP